MQKVGIIGNGFVGNSIAFGFSPTHDVKVHDKDSRRNMNTIEEVLECDYIFVAVETPLIFKLPEWSSTNLSVESKLYNG